MFTGIIEAVGTVLNVQTDGGNRVFSLNCPFSRELKADQSVAHNGVCLTVTGVRDQSYEVVAIAETLRKTNLGDLKTGDRVNLERCLQANGRIDGHIVQGHVDITGTVEEVKDDDGSKLIRISYAEAPGHLVVPRGSVCINGVSLTVASQEGNQFTVAIIPYTLHHTNLINIREGQRVNIEFDILGKYVEALLKREGRGGMQFPSDLIR